MNELNNRIDNLHKIVSKLNEYYETNHLKSFSVEDIANRLDQAVRSIEAKAPILDVKKIVSRLNELEETVEGMNSNGKIPEIVENKFMELEKSF